jgi:2-oxoglutarate dehydrogenase E2 component (dihydrolipoamide succinyltransferase)
MAMAELVMPKLGESIMEATILKWHKKVGDTVKQDETVLDIATDKVDSEVPSTAEGTIAEILFNINDVVPIGTVIARIDLNGAAAGTPAAQEAEKIPVATAPVPEPAPEMPAETITPYSMPEPEQPSPWKKYRKTRRRKYHTHRQLQKGPLKRQNPALTVFILRLY